MRARFAAPRCAGTTVDGCRASTPAVLTVRRGGKTLTLSLYIYNLTFKFIPNLGYAATVSYVIVILVALLAFLQFYAAREREQ